MDKFEYTFVVEVGDVLALPSGEYALVKMIERNKEYLDFPRIYFDIYMDEDLQHISRRTGMTNALTVFKDYEFLYNVERIGVNG